MANIEQTFGISKVIAKHLTGALSGDEQQLLDAWLAADEKHAAIFNRITAHENMAAALAELEQVDTELALANVKSRISADTPIKPVIKLWPGFRIKPSMAGLAAAVALIVLGVYFFNYRAEILRNALDDKNVLVNDVAPGKNGATLTLANGKVIQLSDAKSGVVIADDLKYSDGTDLDDRHPEFSSGSRTREATITAKTAKGQTYEFTLPDGTKVWLNAASSLTIPFGFSGTESRIVELSGEAYFEVATSYTSLRGRRTKQSFVVKTAGNNGRPGQEVTVLGTHFNINAYADEPDIKTTLLEGSVRVSLNDRQANTPRHPDPLTKAGTSIVLKPNQQASLNKDFQIRVQEVRDAERAMFWRKNGSKYGTMLFDNEDLESLMRKVSRWYDVEVEYRFTHKNGEGRYNNERQYSGAISRDATLSQVMKILKNTQTFTFKIEGRRLIIMD